MKMPFARAAAVVLVLAAAGTPLFADAASATAAYEDLLARYVTPRGVRYDAWRASGSDLKTISEIVMVYRNTDPKALTPIERKALYINLYNARILELVLFANPHGSIKTLSKGVNAFEIFSRGTIGFDGKVISLNDLEKRLRDEFKDPRVHFAVNCASKSCPPIRPEPFAAGTLEAQLDDATRRFLASPGAADVRTEGGKSRIVASRIFDWYGSDFKATGGPLAFIQKFGPAEAAEAAADAKTKLDFSDYDWGLNAAK